MKFGASASSDLVAEAAKPQSTRDYRCSIPSRNSRIPCGGRARRVTVTATVRAEKGPHGIPKTVVGLTGVVDGLEGIDDAQMKEIARETEERCTVTIALRERVSVTDIVSR
jgi:hypothetical protein